MKTYIIEQKITVMANQYRIFSADDEGNKQEQIAFAHQKRLAFKERVDFFTDESRQKILFSIKARKIIDFAARYDVLDERGEVIGAVGKAFKKSLLRSTWQVFAPNHEEAPLLVAQERNQTLAFVRRVWELAPYISDLPFFVKYHFDFMRPGDDRVLATYNKTTTVRDHYILRVEDEIADEIDWRTLVSLGVLMDALQSR